MRRREVVAPRDLRPRSCGDGRGRGDARPQGPHAQGHAHRRRLEPEAERRERSRGDGDRDAKLRQRHPREPPEVGGRAPGAGPLQLRARGSLRRFRREAGHDRHRPRPRLAQPDAGLGVRGQGRRPLDRETALSRMREHIRTVVGRYKGRIKGWDVVNEAIDDGPEGTMRKSKWREVIGDDYIAKAFEFAHEADPQAELYYNDYNLTNAPSAPAPCASSRRSSSGGSGSTASGSRATGSSAGPPSRTSRRRSRTSRPPASRR